MVRFTEKEIAKEKFYAAKNPIKIWSVNVDNIVVLKLFETKTNSKYFIGVKFDKAIRPLVLIMPKMIGYVKTFKVGNKINKLMSFRIDNEKLLESYQAISTKTEDLKNIELHALPVCDDRYIKTKIKTYDDKVYTNFRGLNVPEDDVECELFTVISINSLLVYDEKYYLQVFLDNCAYKTVNKQVTDYLDENLLKHDLLYNTAGYVALRGKN